MPGALSYDYAIIRVVPRVEREEFLNVGVLLSAESTDFLEAKVQLDESCLLAMAPGTDVDLVRKHLASIPLICRGGPGSGPIGALKQRPRFHWLTAVRSSMIQTSPVHGGRTSDPAEALQRLFDQHVAR